MPIPFHDDDDDMGQDTVEQRIEEILGSKAALFDQIVDNASIDPARLSQQDWLDVVGL